MNFFDHKDLGNHLLQLCPKVVKHPVFPARCHSDGVRTKTLFITVKQFVLQCSVESPVPGFRISELWQT